MKEQMLYSWKRSGASEQEIRTLMRNKENILCLSTLDPAAQRRLEDMRIGIGTSLDSLSDGVEGYIQGFENIIAECPPDHDPFLLHRKADTIKSCPEPKSAIEWLFKRLNDIFRGRSKILPLPQDRYSCIRPVIEGSTDFDQYELNLRKMVEDREKYSFVIGSTKADGQTDVTYLPIKKAREVVYYLIEKGADVSAINTFGYSPECYAYNRHDLMWNMDIDLSFQATYAPTNFWHTCN